MPGPAGKSQAQVPPVAAQHWNRQVWWVTPKQDSGTASGRLGSWKKGRTKQQLFPQTLLMSGKHTRVKAACPTDGDFSKEVAPTHPSLPTLNILNAVIKRICHNENNHVNVPGLLTRQRVQQQQLHWLTREADLTLAVPPSPFSKFNASEELLKFHFV